MDAMYIEVIAEPRYWEDAEIDGHEDVGGSLVPFREGDLWKPVIRLEDGQIMAWPPETKALIHYKVCDQGEYWLLDGGGNRIAKWRGDYVPNNFLCHGDDGYGDYIIFRVDEDGKIIGWVKPAMVSLIHIPPSRSIAGYPMASVAIGSHDQQGSTLSSLSVRAAWPT